jgi:hypothetical protein
MNDIYSTWTRANIFVSLLPLSKSDFKYQNGRYFYSVSSMSDIDFFPIPIPFFWIFRNLGTVNLVPFCKKSIMFEMILLPEQIDSKQ